MFYNIEKEMFEKKYMQILFGKTRKIYTSNIVSFLYTVTITTIFFFKLLNQIHLARANFYLGFFYKDTKINL